MGGSLDGSQPLERTPSRARWLLAAVVALLFTACGGDAAGPPTAGTPAAGPTAASPADQLSGTVRLYTSVTQDTVDAVLAAYRQAQPDVDVEVFRAPTGELTARIAAEQREGRVRADVLWLTDPPSMHQYAAQGLLRRWTPEQIDVVAPDFREDTFFGTRLLNMVIVHQDGLEPAPSSWQDLAAEGLPQPVAIPDPGFAGSAFGALGYFALEEDFGFDYYRQLEANGAVQVKAPGDVVTGVAEGRFAAGMTLDNTARTAVEKGSPVRVVFPEPGAVAIYSPIAVVATTEAPDVAESLAAFTLTREAQQAIAATGWQPVRDDVPWEHGGPTVTPDWEAVFDRQEELLAEYRSIFGG